MKSALLLASVLLTSMSAFADCSVHVVGKVPREIVALFHDHSCSVAAITQLMPTPSQVLGGVEIKQADHWETDSVEAARNATYTISWKERSTSRFPKFWKHGSSQYMYKRKTSTLSITRIDNSTATLSTKTNFEIIKGMNVVLDNPGYKNVVAMLEELDGFLKKDL